jgi:hypothetical protein
MNSKFIGVCRHCDQDFCQECSNAKDYSNYCSKSCEDEDLAYERSFKCIYNKVLCIDCGACSDYNDDLEY